MSRKTAQEAAVRLARERLGQLPVADRCPQLGLRPPQGHVLSLRAFARDLRLDLKTGEFQPDTAGRAPALTDQILVLHYLLCDVPVSTTDELISFRDFPGGAFYYEPFRARTSNPLQQRFGRDLDALRNNLVRFDAALVAGGDLAARVHTLGSLSITIVAHQADEEFPARVDVLFPATCPRVYGAEDAAAMASRVCIGLL